MEKEDGGSRTSQSTWVPIWLSNADDTRRLDGYKGSRDSVGGLVYG